MTTKNKLARKCIPLIVAWDIWLEKNQAICYDHGHTFLCDGLQRLFTSKHWYKDHKLKLLIFFYGVTQYYPSKGGIGVKYLSTIQNYFYFVEILDQPQIIMLNYFLWTPFKNSKSTKPNLFTCLWWLKSCYRLDD